MLNYPAESYHWVRSESGFWCLIPTDEPNCHSFRRIASMYYSRGLSSYVVSYYWPFSTGHKQSGWAYRKTVQSAKTWTEKQLNKFWEPPAVTA